jgi:diadenosine hexaphosphate hydrolase (ATP-forming)
VKRLVASPNEPVEGAGGIVFNSEHKVLLLKHKNGSWVFPKGHIDPAETTLEAAAREVEEEAGITVSCPAPGFWLSTRYRNDRRQERLIHWFLLHTKDTKPTCPEALFPEGGFFDPHEALAKLSYDEDKRLLAAALRHQGRLQNRLQDTPSGGKLD